MAPKKFSANPLGQVFLDSYTQALGRVAYRSAYELEQAAKEKYDEFFEDMVRGIARESTPHPVAFTGTSWSDITEQWADAKGSYFSNQFYVGIGPKGWDSTKGSRSYLDDMATKETERAYGELAVSLEIGNKDIDVSALNRDVNLGRFRYKGRFISPEQLGLRIKIDAFPEVKTEKGLSVRSFSPRTRRILKFNEPFGTPTSWARPFLQPMFEYYVEHALPRKIQRALR